MLGWHWTGRDVRLALDVMLGWHWTGRDVRLALDWT